MCSLTLRRWQRGTSCSAESREGPDEGNKMHHVVCAAGLDGTSWSVFLPGRGETTTLEEIPNDKNKRARYGLCSGTYGVS